MKEGNLDDFGTVEPVVEYKHVMVVYGGKERYYHIPSDERIITDVCMPIARDFGILADDYTCWLWHPEHSPKNGLEIKDGQPYVLEVCQKAFIRKKY